MREVRWERMFPDELELVDAYDEQKARADALAREVAELKARLGDR